MGEEIRVVPELDYDAFVSIQVNAYPGAQAFSAEDRERWKQNLIKEKTEDPRAKPWGLYRDGALIGVMKTYDYEMTLLSQSVLTGGVGSVAVDLLHKKERAAYELLKFFVKHYRERGALAAALYPFRHDFYKKMGFGYGGRVNQYRLKPGTLPSGPKSHICMLSKEDIPELLLYYNALAKNTSGMMQYIDTEFRRLMERNTHFVAYKENSKIRGYAAYSFRKAREDNFLLNDMVVRQMFADRDALLELMAFFNSQADQVNRIVFSVMDDGFYTISSDPRNGSDNNLTGPVAHEVSAEGLGIMFRLLDVKGAFQKLANHDFGGGNCILCFDIEDTFLPENAGRVTVSFVNGYPTVLPDSQHKADAVVSMDISEFSSMFMGVIRFADLYRYHRAEISNPALVGTVSRIFRTDERPKCVTYF